MNTPITDYRALLAFLVIGAVAIMLIVTVVSWSRDKKPPSE